jgi:hypothetical protein
VVDQAALRRVGLSFGALTVFVTLIGAAVVKQQIDSQPTVDLLESVAAMRLCPRRLLLEHDVFRPGFARRSANPRDER